ncbi:MAG: hypothetical protein RLN99_08035 [Kiloniellaceae bacterium]
MAERVRVLYVLFEGLPETVIDSQVAEHIRMVREGLGWDFELWAFACTSNGMARSLRRRDAVESHTGCQVRVLRGVRPAVPSSRRLNGLQLSRAIGNGRPPFDLVHARTDYTAATMGPVARRHGLPMIWDCRGDSVAEFEARADQGGLASNLLRRWRSANLVEDRRVAAHHAAAALFVSEPLQALCTPQLGDKPAAVIPCVASQKDMYFSPDLRQSTRAALSMPDDLTVFVYSGSLAAYQCFAQTVDLFRSVHAVRPQTHLLVLTPQKAQADEILSSLPQGSFTSVSARYREVNAYLNAADLAFMLREDTPVNRVASPTKFAEYCLAGLPVIMTDAVRDSAIMADRIGNWVAPEPQAILAAPVPGRAVIAQRAGELLSRSRYLSSYEKLCNNIRRRCAGGEG